ncbi:hypothetical protein DFJ58DRAFT_737038 [Suillus subalutaceus]|uniref:uncharacterized protein n=1 Tax=Suillus subalutaceus TaxID=48586 RepID=UPI001B88178E|nr:uncharacterized protein DFJ58DRAFT_737038 [Suillus subalutaceus]KAG1830270.1 hypothetical protein DFJ58DRAFT_737038 [Suillus subalutaceus]
MPHCSKKFKTQGFKKHEASCKKQKDTKAERAEFALQYARDQRRARQQAYTDMGMITPSAGPSRSVAGIQNAPPAIKDHGPLDNPNAGDFEAYDGNFEGAGSLANSQRGSVEPQPAIPPPQPIEFKTVYHPSARREPLLQTFEEFGVNTRPEEELPVDEEPWRPFCSRGDFEFAEIALNAALNKSHIDGLLALIGRISRGESRVTFKNDIELRKAWEHATAQVTPFVKHDITVPYKKEQRVYETHALPLWDWALDLLANPLLAPHFVWDAQQVFKHNGREFERFYNEPWTGDRWWDIQAFGIRNGEGIGGGRVVGWLPILQVSEDADEEGKPGFVNLKRVVWHEAFLKLLELVAILKIARWLFPIILILSADYEEQCMMSLIRGHHSKCPCPVCLVPLEELSELSKTFAFRSVEEAIAALNVYKVSKARGEELLKALGLRAVTVQAEMFFWLISHSDPHQAISFDRLHALHLGMWRHLLEELKKILKALGRDEESKVENRLLVPLDGAILIISAPSSPLPSVMVQDARSIQAIFYSVVNVFNQRTSPEGYKLLHVISSYLQLDSYIGLDVHYIKHAGSNDAELLVFDSALKTTSKALLNSPIEGLKLDWTSKGASLEHATRDIRMKGVVRNSQHPSE